MARARAAFARYLRERRQHEFVENLCRQLLAFALGRRLRLSDEETVESLTKNLAANGHRFRILIEGIVTSPQLLDRRGDAEPTRVGTRDLQKAAGAR